MRFVKANLVNAGYQSELRERQQRWRKVDNQDNFDFRNVLTAVTLMQIERAIDAISDYRNLNDDRVATIAESLRSPEIEHLELAPQQWRLKHAKLYKLRTSNFCTRHVSCIIPLRFIWFLNVQY